MKLNVVCIFENSESTIKECVASIKNQYFSDYKVTLIDNNSSDLSYNIVHNLIKDDKRFKLIKNNVKKFYASNIIENFSKSKKLNWSDVILEINPDEKLVDNNVFGLITKIFNNENNWILIDSKNKNNLTELRSSIDNNIDNIQKLKIFKSFLLWSVQVNQNSILKSEKINNRNLSYALPILEMSDSSHIVSYLDLFVKVGEPKIKTTSYNLDEIKNIAKEIPQHNKINLIQNTIFRSSSVSSYHDPFTNFNIKKKSILPNIQDQKINLPQEKSKDPQIIEEKIDLKKIIVPKNLNHLLDNKIVKTRTEDLVEPTKNIINTTPTKVIKPTLKNDNLIVQKIINKKIIQEKKPQPKIEQNQPTKKINQIDYNNINLLFQKSHPQKSEKSPIIKKETNKRNEVFEIKQRQVHREIKLPKPNLSETKPKANIKIR
jgi:glycosyltransferase involved in cell wall biosynthesis